MSAEADLRKAAADFQQGAVALGDVKTLLRKIEALLTMLISPGQQAAQEAMTTKAKRITEQPVHSGQIPPKGNKVTEFGEHSPPTPKLSSTKP